MYWPWIIGRIYNVDEEVEDKEDKADDDADDEIV